MSRKRRERRRIDIQGPFWHAKADLFEIEKPVANWVARTLFVDNQPRRFFNRRNVFVPGTGVALCRVRQVQFELTSSRTPRYVWRSSADPLPDPTTSEIRAHLEAGTLSLLLLQADPESWAGEDEAPPEPALTCLAGDISLDVMRPHQTGNDPDARQRLYRALHLEAAQDEAVAGRFPALSVNASGVSVYGQIELPWQTKRLAVPLQLVHLRSDRVEPGYRLSIEVERLVPAEAQALVNAWQELNRLLSPRHPLSRPQSETTAPAWVTLEIADPSRVPTLYWEIAPWQSEPAMLPLHFQAGELNLIVSDQPPYQQENPPTSLVRVVPQRVVIEQVESESLAVRVKAGPDTTPADETATSLSYHAQRERTGQWLEKVKLGPATLTFDPVQTAQQLRADQNLPAPEWAAGDQTETLERPLLWGFMPLADGWAQLPVLNLTEQIYLDTELAQVEAPETETTESWFQGAVSLGNSQPQVLLDHPQEQPWRLTLTDAHSLRGTWRLSPAETENGRLQLANVSLVVSEPEVALHGLFWLSRDEPTPENALPENTDWVSGVLSVPLRRVTPSDLFPAAQLLSLEQLSFSVRPSSTEEGPRSAQLQGYQLQYGTDDETMSALTGAGVIAPDLLSRYPPLLWRRHPTLPMIQALPLTQSRTPPNYSSRSRQLVPFAPTEGAVWRFGVEGDNGAVVWPSWLGAMQPAADWQAAFDLPLVSLSLPGLVLDPTLAAEAGLGPDAATDLPQQYRFDLPYTDEVNALAQLPRVPPDESAVSPLPDAPPPKPPQPLQRETFADHWQRLSEQASLAAVDAVAAFIRSQGQTLMQHLIEPLTWLVELKLNTDAYPGRLLVTDSEANEARIDLRGETSLRGVHGRFSLDDAGQLRLLPAGTKDGDNPYQIDAGAMAARAADGTFQDQRGLARAATAPTGTLLRTLVQLEQPDHVASYTLTSTQVAIPLQAGGRTWHLWFRDLPLRGDVFDRQQTRSSLAQDVNDPEAQSRDFNVLAGYEWRLAEETAVADLQLNLYHLAFYPLTLEKVVVNDERVMEVEIIGRLQLPVAGAGEVAELGNAIRLVFKAQDESGLALDAVHVEASAGQWPLALHEGEAAAAPHISWTQTSLQDSGDTAPVLVLGGGRLHFFLFDVEWFVALDDLVFPSEKTILEQTISLLENDTPSPLRATELTLQLDLDQEQYQASVALAINLGSAQRPLLRGIFTLPLQPGSVPTIEAQSVRLFNRIELLPAGDLVLQLRHNGVQMSWQRYQPEADTPAFFLPGMALSGGESPGFAALTFTAVPQSSGVARLRLDSCFMETLLSCAWGEFLQVSGASLAETGSLTTEQVFGSSAGNITAAVTARWQANEKQWAETFLLNGILEVKSLISWPAAMAYDETKSRLTLPAAGGDSAFDHWRHTVRILFNQHELPPELLVTGNTRNEPSLLFHLAADKSWQFLAAVEHQLLHVSADGELRDLSAQAQWRWTVPQEVRVLGPALFKEFLDLSQRHVADLVPKRGRLHEQDGYFRKPWWQALTDADSPERLDLLPANTLLVEASTPHWLRLGPLDGSSDGLSATGLQFLPGGTQSGILSGPEDYAPSSIEAPAWLLLTTPFFGRLQPPTQDGLEKTGWEQRTAVQIDPVLRLARQQQATPEEPRSPLSHNLASWGGDQPVEIDFSAFDSAVGRTWSRLDATALEESWFRLQHPLPEPEPGGLSSIMAARPNTPARLSRDVALRWTFDVFRPFYPPKTPDDYELPPSVETGALVWRPRSLLVWQSVNQNVDSEEIEYSWAGVGLHLVSSGLTAADGARLRYLPAATVLPARLEVHGQDNPWPLHLAVSPYLGLDFRRTPDSGSEFRLASAELLSVSSQTGTLRPVASRFYAVGTDAEVTAQSRIWAREVHRRLTPDSPLAVLRLRHIYENTDLGSDEAVLITRYEFALLDVESERELDQRVFRLRTDVAELRYREGQFGGNVVPTEAVRSFALAPPQTTGVQPLYLTERPSGGDAAVTWPWGLSALRISLQYTAQKQGVAQVPLKENGDGDSDGSTLWWHVIQHQVQYRSGVNGSPAAGLPALFRARAIQSLLPVVATPPMPQLENEGPDSWQPILPGAMRYLLSGARPGAFFALRHHLISQRADFLHISGGVPVQHRMPRPVPLPPNQASGRQKALQTWASHFEPERNVLSHSAPVDTAYFAANEDSSDRGLLMTLTAPERGAIGPDWNGELEFALRLGGQNEEEREEWQITLELHDAATSFGDTHEKITDDGDVTFVLQPAKGNGSPVVQLRSYLATKPPGSLLTLKARVRPSSAADGFEQVLAFPLRLLDPQALPLPLRPQFIHFEDPEYNRRLVSLAGRDERLLKITDNAGEEQVRAVALATDRRQYNPDSELYLRYDWDGGPINDDSGDDDHTKAKGSIALARLSRDNIKTELEQSGDSNELTDLAPATLRRISLAKLAEKGDTAPALQPGDLLQLTLKIPVSPREHEELSLDVDIVAEPVVPVPKAAYALLRWQQVAGREEVECARFAWGPEASRIELISTEDLRQEVVRRRGVFQWLDTVRPNTLQGYAIQKIAQNGATHFPEPVIETE